MNNIRPLRSTASLVLTYTLIFCLTMAGIFALFILNGKSFVNHADAFDQGYFWTIEMKHNLQSLLSGNGYPLWSWDRGMGMDAKLPIDPFLVLASFFPLENIELGYTLAIILRLYFAGLAFIFFTRQVKMNNFSSLLASLFYVASAWTINTALIQGQFIGMMIIFPLLIASVDRIYQAKSPWLFIASVAYAVSLNYYLAYMAAIVVIIYIFIRYFHYNTSISGKYFVAIGRFILYGISGILISAVFVLVTIKTLMGASLGGAGVATDSGEPSLGFLALHDMSVYLTTGLRLLSKGYSFTYTNVGLPILGTLILLIPMAKPSIRHTHSLMAILLGAMTFFPFFGSMFNGFGYVSNRWYFTLIFFLAWTAGEHMNLDKLGEVKRFVLSLICWAALLASTLGFCYLDIAGSLTKKELAFVAGNLLAGFVTLVYIFFSKRKGVSLRSRQALVTVAVIASLSLSWTASFYGRTGHYFEYGEISRMLETSTQRVGSMIEDDGFYRIDQVDWLNFSHKADQPVNENLRWQSNTLYVYDSKLPASLTEFNRLVGNNLGYSKRVYMQSNGNRMGLDFLLGVRYFLGDDVKNMRLGANAYAPYGFEPLGGEDSYASEGSLDGVNVFKNKYNASLGYVYNRYIRESEFMKLSRLEREQALLQALVIPDATIDEILQSANAGTMGAREARASEIETAIRQVPYTYSAYDGIEEVSQRPDGTFTFLATKENASMVLHPQDSSQALSLLDGTVDKSQVVVSFDNLRRYNDNKQEVANFYLSCQSDKLNSDASNTKNNQTISGIVDFDLNMGCYDSPVGDLTITFSRPGTYTFDKLYISAMSSACYDKYANERMTGAFIVDSYDARSVKGSVNAAEDGFLFISLPIYDNWDLYIDGYEMEVIGDSNIAFMAAKITSGVHDVELRYDFSIRYISLAITALGLLIAIILCITSRAHNSERSS